MIYGQINSELKNQGKESRYKLSYNPTGELVKMAANYLNQNKDTICKLFS